MDLVGRAGADHQQQDQRQWPGLDERQPPAAARLDRRQEQPGSTRRRTLLERATSRPRSQGARGAGGVDDLPLRLTGDPDDRHDRRRTGLVEHDAPRLEPETVHRRWAGTGLHESQLVAGLAVGVAEQPHR